MDFIKHYINQSITIAANNLRLNNQQIEIVALLKDMINKSENLGDDLINMKKITELSTLAIRLNDIHNFLRQNHIDLLKISEQFKEHSRFLIKDLGHMLEVSTTVSFKSAVEKLHNGLGYSKPEIKVDLSKRKREEELFIKPETATIKEKIILEDVEDEEDELIQNFELTILKPIKQLDIFLKKLSKNEVDYEELINYSNLMKDNGELAKKIGFEIISNMHKIVSRALLLIRDRDLLPGKEVIENLRSCLIVIVAVVRGKDVDISNYLNHAEEFGNKISIIKSKDI